MLTSIYQFLLVTYTFDMLPKMTFYFCQLLGDSMQGQSTHEKNRKGMQIWRHSILQKSDCDLRNLVKTPK